MKKQMIIIFILIGLVACKEKDVVNQNVAAHLIGTWSFRGQFDNHAPIVPKLYWKDSKGIYQDPSAVACRIQFRDNGTYALTLDSLASKSGFNWDTVSYVKPYSILGNRIKGLILDYVYGNVYKKMKYNDINGIIVRDSISNKGSVSRDSINYNFFQKIEFTVYESGQFTGVNDYTLISDKFELAKRDTIVRDPVKSKPWIYLRIVKIN